MGLRPRGSAFIWVDPDRQAQIHPLTVSHYLNEGFAREFSWQGTRDFSGWLSIPAAIDFFAELGWDKVIRHNASLAAWVQDMLCQRWGVEPIGPTDGSMNCPMCTIPLPPPLDRLAQGQSDALQLKLYSQHRIEVPVVRWGERIFVRPCCQVYNVAEDYERLAAAIETEMTQEQRMQIREEDQGALAPLCFSKYTA